MRTVEDQQSVITASAVAPRPVRVGIFEAQNLLAAEDVTSEVSMPLCDLSAIDGYAVRSVDVVDAGAEITSYKEDEDQSERVVVTLPVVGHVRAGDSNPTRLSPQQAVRVDVGAPLPHLADAVVPIKWTDQGLDRVRIGHTVRSGDYIRKIGNDVQEGDVIVRAGNIIGSAQIGLLASAGYQKVLVHPRPRLSVIAVGGELTSVDSQLGPGKVYDVVSYALAAAARDAGADVHRVGIIDFQGDALYETLQTQVVRSEIVVIAAPLGGDISARICASTQELGALEECRIAMHPGAIQGFGQLGRDDVPTFLLPSNPVAALIAFEVMVRPLIRIVMGKRQALRRVVSARTLSPLRSFPHRRGYIRGQLLREESTGDFLVQPLGGSPTASSHLLQTLSEANCLILIPEEITEIATGDEVSVMFLAQRG